MLGIVAIGPNKMTRQARQDWHLGVVQFFLGLGGCTSLQRPSYNGDTGFVRILFENGAEVNTRDNSNWTPLYGASQRGIGMLFKFSLIMTWSQTQIRVTLTTRPRCI